MTKRCLNGIFLSLQYADYNRNIKYRAVLNVGTCLRYVGVASRLIFRSM